MHGGFVPAIVKINRSECCYVCLRQAKRDAIEAERRKKMPWLNLPKSDQLRARFRIPHIDRDIRNLVVAGKVLLAQWCVYR
jgi:hypothetical protein